MLNHENLINILLELLFQITRRDEEMAPFIAEAKRKYIFGGICNVAANTFIRVCTVKTFTIPLLLENSFITKRNLFCWLGLG